MALRTSLAAAALATLLAGVPWALTRFVGWPLPDHLPSWPEVRDAVLSPITPAMLLDFVAYSTWLVWALFVVDVARCTATILRGGSVPNLSTAGPVRRIAAVLVGAFLITSPGQLSGSPPPAHTLTGQLTAPHMNGPGTVAPRAKFDVVRAYDAEADVYDSLWRMAERTLGDGNRWPEIYELNKGKPQPHNGTFTCPSLVYPGEEMLLPDEATATPHPQPAPPPPAPTPPPEPARTPAPPPATAPTTQSTVASREPAHGWGQSVFVGLGLASAVSAALMVVRRRARRRYRPGSGDRHDLPIAPVVYQLRLAHLRAGQDDLGLEAPDRRPPLVPGHTGGDGSPVVPIGVRDGREIAMDLATSHGLGLIGPGASAAIRALAITALTSATGTAHGQVVVPAEDVAPLFGRQMDQDCLPAGVRVVPDLDAALNALEAETLTRASRPVPDVEAGPVVLVTRAPGLQSRRLQAVLDNGGDVGIVGLVLGQWDSGVTAYVREDGSISATSPGPGESLRGTRVFHLADHQARDLLHLLRQAESQEPTHPDEPPLPDAGLELLDTDGEAPIHTAATAQAQSPHAHDQPPGSGEASGAPLCITALGPLRVWRRNEAGDELLEVTGAFQPRVRELLMYLALHPGGSSREALISALWPASSPEKVTNALNTALSRLRRCVVTATDGTVHDIVIAGAGRFRLNTALVEVDYHRFAAAVAQRRTATTDQQRAEAYQRIVDTYTGPLAEGLDAEWIDATREATRRDFIDAVAALARTLIEQDPQKTLDLLEVARTSDPHNELIYRDIMRLQERLGQADAITRTLNLLATRLEEIDERPTEQTVSLVQRLRARKDAEQEMRQGA